MPRLVVLPHEDLCPQGTTVRAKPGQSICSALLENGIEIEHACEQSCACTTCHVVVREGFDALSEADEIEEDLLDRAWGLEATSLLSCQAIVTDDQPLKVVIATPIYSKPPVTEKSISPANDFPGSSTRGFSGAMM